MNILLQMYNITVGFSERMGTYLRLTQLRLSRVIAPALGLHVIWEGVRLQMQCIHKL